MLTPFLTAHWQYLAMLNFRIDPELLAPHVPAGTELDFFNGETYVSVVGFLFYHTFVMGVPIPRHRNFEEVNLRFYVRKKSADDWRRGTKWESLAISAHGEAQRVVAGSHEEFITEHYWATRNATRARASTASSIRAGRFGPRRRSSCGLMSQRSTAPKFVAALTAPPVSAFIADGSFVTVYRSAAEEPV